jgi:hypothetical protein
VWKSVKRNGFAVNGGIIIYKKKEDKKGEVWGYLSG